jgi:hypothetical protein
LTSIGSAGVGEGGSGDVDDRGARGGEVERGALFGLGHAGADVAKPRGLVAELGEPGVGAAWGRCLAW